MSSQPAPAGDLRPGAAGAPRSTAPRLLPSHPHAPAGLRGRAGPPCRPPCPARTPGAHVHVGHDLPIQAHPLGRPQCHRGAVCLPPGPEEAFQRKGEPPPPRGPFRAAGGPSSPAGLSWCGRYAALQSRGPSAGSRSSPDGTCGRKDAARAQPCGRPAETPILMSVGRFRRAGSPYCPEHGCDEQHLQVPLVSLRVSGTGPWELCELEAGPRRGPGREPGRGPQPRSSSVLLRSKFSFHMFK